MGPKTVHAKTLRRLASAGVRQRASPGNNEEFQARTSERVTLPDPRFESSNASQWEGVIPLGIMERYLEIYHGKMYQIWPVVDVGSLIRRLREAPFDAEDYMLASSVCVATILQLQLVVEGSAMPNPQSCVDEVERIRHANHYRRRPTLQSLLTSFFLHISYLHFDQQMISTLLLREAISMLHLLDLHQPGHYVNLDHATSQADLRILWLLFITERGHARQYDLPCTVTIPTQLPRLQQDDSQPGFVSLCNMFACFDSVDASRELTEEQILTVDSQLVMTRNHSQFYNSLQQADLLVTRQWIRLLLWKTAICRLTMTTEASGTLSSIVFPVQAARDLLSGIACLSMDALEAHGPGMELKLFTMATSLADVMTCMPVHSTVVSEFGARDCLLQMSEMLGNFRGGTEAVMSVLRERLVEIGLDQTPLRCITEVGWASDESDFSESPSIDTRAEVTELYDDEFEHTSDVG